MSFPLFINIPTFALEWKRKKFFPELILVWKKQYQIKCQNYNKWSRNNYINCSLFILYVRVELNKYVLCFHSRNPWCMWYTSHANVFFCFHSKVNLKWLLPNTHSNWHSKYLGQFEWKKKSVSFFYFPFIFIHCKTCKNKCICFLSLNKFVPSIF